MMAQRLRNSLLRFRRSLCWHRWDEVNLHEMALTKAGVISEKDSHGRLCQKCGRMVNNLGKPVYE